MNLELLSRQVPQRQPCPPALKVNQHVLHPMQRSWESELPAVLVSSFYLHVSLTCQTQVVSEFSWFSYRNGCKAGDRLVRKASLM